MVDFTHNARTVHNAPPWYSVSSVHLRRRWLPAPHIIYAERPMQGGPMVLGHRHGYAPDDLPISLQTRCITPSWGSVCLVRYFYDDFP